MIYNVIVSDLKSNIVNWELKVDLLITVVLPIIQCVGTVMISNACHLPQWVSNSFGIAIAAPLVAYGLANIICDILMYNGKIEWDKAVFITSVVFVAASLAAAIAIPILTGVIGLIASGLIITFCLGGLVHSFYKYLHLVKDSSIEAQLLRYSPEREILDP